MEEPGRRFGAAKLRRRKGRKFSAKGHLNNVYEIFIQGRQQIAKTKTVAEWKRSNPTKQCQRVGLDNHNRASPWRHKKITRSPKKGWKVFVTCAGSRVCERCPCFCKKLDMDMGTCGCGELQELLIHLYLHIHTNINKFKYIYIYIIYIYLNIHLYLFFYLFLDLYVYRIQKSVYI